MIERRGFLGWILALAAIPLAWFGLKKPAVESKRCTEEPSHPPSGTKVRLILCTDSRLAARIALEWLGCINDREWDGHEPETVFCERVTLLMIPGKSGVQRPCVLVQYQVSNPLFCMYSSHCRRVDFSKIPA